jgi:hypothetical protein
VYDVRIISANYSSTDLPMSPASYAINYYNDSTKKQQQTKYKALIDALGGMSFDDYTKDVSTDRVGGDASGTITYDMKWNSVDLAKATLPNTNEHEYQKA